ncbi:class I SAM-dependent methyltransferase [Desulfovibrio sp. TomC]|uniref:class I SAM-dependent methyltransferase n=1 Tax=Desulfovibrio sp. TomC TaxID=1562888 RepID=UPI000574537E|nr:class I SAM-dependent methyltransferase [Desulfovibrio sp. TomC]KHK01475.1 Methyltransferase type 11 [Desulfovibrio sp. TomC]
MGDKQDVAAFLAISRDVFAPLYPYYADTFIYQSGIRRGLCLDLGCGGGQLGLSVAAASACFAVLLDQSPAMLQAAVRGAAQQGLAKRAVPLLADVHALPLQDGSVDLAVSRGSLMFWKDLPKAFAEVRRVLSPKGRAYLGGGLGPPLIREAICRQMAGRDPRWAQGIPPPRPGTEPETHAKFLRAAGIEHFTITREDAGHWITFGK